MMTLARSCGIICNKYGHSLFWEIVSLCFVFLCMHGPMLLGTGRRDFSWKKPPNNELVSLIGQQLIRIASSDCGTMNILIHSSGGEITEKRFWLLPAALRAFCATVVLDSTAMNLFQTLQTRWWDPDWRGMRRPDRPSSAFRRSRTRPTAPRPSQRRRTPWTWWLRCPQIFQSTKKHKKHLGSLLWDTAG